MDVKPLLNVQDLRTYFYSETRGTVRAVDGVSLEIGEKRVVGLVGESGSGKSQTALSIMRLVRTPGKIVSGRVLYKSKDLLKVADEEMRKIRGTQISMVFQDPATYLNPVMKCGDQIAEKVILHQGLKKDEARRITLRELEKVKMPSLPEVLDYYPHQLSGGMKQRIMIAMALSCNPSLIIADEPTTSLDVTVQAQIMNLIKELIEKHGLSLLLITHDLGIIADICDEVYVMYAGKIVEHTDSLTIFRGSKHPYTLGLLESALSIDSFKETLVGIDGAVPDLSNPPPGCRFNPRCRFAMTICHDKEPPTVEIKKGHMVSCWLYKQVT